VEVQEFRWVESGSRPADDYIFFFHGCGNASHQLGTGFFLYKGIISEAKWVEFISHRMSYITLRCWCDVIVLNVHAPTEDKSDDTKNSLFEEPESVFDQLPECHMGILLGDFNENVGRRMF
jgi:hypothetical protein